MLLKVPLYSISLLALTGVALSQAQGPSDPSAQQQQVLDDAATALATLQDQIPKDITAFQALQALASNGKFGGNARLASENSLLIAILARVPQLAQDLSAALNQTKFPAPAATPTPTPTPTPITPPSQDPVILKKQCDLLQSLLLRATLFKEKAAIFSRSNVDGGAGLFYTAKTYSQNNSGCQGNPSDACKSFNDLEAEFQVVGDQVLAAYRLDSTPDSGRDKNFEVRISKITGVISRGASALLTTITKIRTSLRCS